MTKTAVIAFSYIALAMAAVVWVGTASVRTVSKTKHRLRFAAPAAGMLALISGLLGACRIRDQRGGA